MITVTIEQTIFEFQFANFLASVAVNGAEIVIGKILSERRFQLLREHLHLVFRVVALLKPTGRKLSQKQNKNNKNVKLNEYYFLSALCRVIFKLSNYTLHNVYTGCVRIPPTNFQG
jgi:hypothetical protein